MSRASMWAKTSRRRPKPFKVKADDGKPHVVASVNDDGELVLFSPQDWTYSEKESLQLRDWLTENFS